MTLQVSVREYNSHHGELKVFEISAYARLAIHSVEFSFKSFTPVRPIQLCYAQKLLSRKVDGMVTHSANV